MSDTKDWSKVDEDELDDAVADGEPGATVEFAWRLGHDLRTARARIATLEARITELTGERDELLKRLDAGRRYFGMTSSERETAARAERDEAVGLLRECFDGWCKGDDIVTPMQAARALLGPLAPAPEKETTP